MQASASDLALMICVVAAMLPSCVLQVGGAICGFSDQFASFRHKCRILHSTRENVRQTSVHCLHLISRFRAVAVTDNYLLKEAAVPVGVLHSRNGMDPIQEAILNISSSKGLRELIEVLAAIVKSYRSH